MVSKDKQQKKQGISQRFRNFRTSQVITPLVVIALLFGLLLTIVARVFAHLQKTDSYLPENTLPILLIFGTLSFLVAVGALVTVYARLDLTSWRSPLGLPEGSVRAIIALLLIVLFFITAVFLYADVGRDGDPRKLTGIDSTRLALIPTENILALTPRDNGTWDIELTNPRNADSRDIAKQLVTTVSTLVVAVASFYFGANSVQHAMTAKGAGGATAGKRGGRRGRGGPRGQATTPPPPPPPNLPSPPPPPPPGAG